MVRDQRRLVPEPIAVDVLERARGVGVELLAARLELRAVGDVLLEQLFFMLRTGFDAFELSSQDPLGDYRTALADFSVWYQPSADGRPTAVQLRHPKR